MSGIFISYRREDSAEYAGRVYDRLCARFGADQVFMDVNNSSGADFGAPIGAHAPSCDAMIVVIGPSWISARDGRGNLRLSDPGDLVAMEIATALRRDIPVFPVLVGKAAMPKAEELRSDLKPLARRNALTLNDEEFNGDVDQLIRTLEAVPGIGSKSAPGPLDSRAELRRKLWRRLTWKAPLIIALVSFAVWWEWRKEKALYPGLELQAPVAAEITGAWSAEVTYSWGEKFTEEFFFQPEGAKLFGTASFLGVKRGIEEGRIDGENIAFLIRFQESSGGFTAEHKNYYWGALDGDKIRMRLQDDRGNPPLDFVLRKSAVRPR